MRSITVTAILLTALLGIAAQVGISQPALPPIPKLVVFLEPEGPPGFVPLKEEGASLQHAENPAYNFIVMAVDGSHPPDKPYASATALVRSGETRRITSDRGEVQVRGTVTVSAPGKAKYEAELLMSGRQSASAAAFVNFGSLKHSQR